MTLKLITAPATEPVTLAEAKVPCRVDGDITTDDGLIEILIAAARGKAEHRIERSLITQTWERVLDFFPESEIQLGWPPIISIVSVTYIDAAGDSQTLAPTAYSLDTDQPPGWLLPAYGTVWPATLDTAGAVRVRFTAGYGSASDVPKDIKAWILLNVADMHPNGDKMTPEQRQNVDLLLDRFKVWSA